MINNDSRRVGENNVSHKIQITVDDALNDTIRSNAEKTGLSVSAYARLILMRVLSQKKTKLLDQAINDVQSSNTETLTLTEFMRQLDKL